VPYLPVFIPSGTYFQQQHICRYAERGEDARLPFMAWLDFYFDEATCYNVGVPGRFLFYISNCLLITLTFGGKTSLILVIEPAFPTALRGTAVVEFLVRHPMIPSDPERACKFST